MTQSTNKFEQLLELLINEENDKAQALFHEIVVEKSRDIYEGLAEAETKEDSKEEVKETEKSEVKAETVKETEKTDSKDESVDETVEIEEESIEEVGGDATDDLIADVSADEKGDAEHGDDANGEEPAADDQADAGIENKIVDLEDALEELKAEFEKMMNGDNGEDSEEKSDESVAIAQPAQDAQAEVAVAQEAKEEMKKETVKEYKIQKSADNKDASDKSAKSPVIDAGTKMGQGSKNIAQADVAKEKAKVPTAEKMGDFENTPGKDKATSYKKEVKADLKDGGDKSASKSPIVAAKK
jgi:hypothetical protein